MGIQVPAGYRPSESEPFMNERQREYFRRKLTVWKEEILRESRGTIQNLQAETTPHAGMPVSRLFQPRNIVDARGGRERIERPAIVAIQWKGIVYAKQSKFFGADFLKVIPRQGKREFRRQWQHSA